MAKKERSIPPLTPQDILRFWSKVRIRGLDECWPWSACKAGMGYGYFRLNGMSFTGQRVAWTIANGPVPAGLCALHRCDNPSCQNPAHLFLGTRADNLHDMWSKGRGVLLPNIFPELRSRGEQCRTAKLTPEKIRDIRRRYASGGVTQAVLGKQYGVDQADISRIVAHKSWAHVL